MQEKPEEIMLLEGKASYILQTKAGESLEAGEGKARIYEESLVVHADFASPIRIPLRDVKEVCAKDYRIRLELFSSEQLVIFDLGYKYADILRFIHKRKNALLLKDLLMEDSLVKSGVRAELLFEKEDNRDTPETECELRLYESAVILLFANRSPIRIPLAEIETTEAKDHRLVIENDRREKYILAKMGRKYDDFIRAFYRLQQEQSLTTQALLRDLMPDLSPLVVRRAADHMKDGKAARRSTLEAISEDLWPMLVCNLEKLGAKKEYDHLETLGQQERIRIGMKRGLMGDMTGEYLWLLVPIYSTDGKRPGNAVAMETVTTEGKSQASYFFRIMGRQDYQKQDSLSEMHAAAETFLQKINRCMLAINFRREPIYLAEKKMEEERYQRYKAAMTLIPELQELRHAFIGRVVHASFAQWKKDVESLLRFNIEEEDDHRQWQK